MKLSLCALLPLSFCLVQCVDPMMYDGGPPGPQGPGGAYPRYDDPYQRSEMRERGNDLNRQAYERGLEDGREDAQARQSQNFNRHRDRFGRSTEMAYRDGYNQAYSQANSSLGAYGNPGYGYGAGQPPAPGYGALPPADQAPPQQQRDPSYNMGYDYGLRDLTSGRVSDPGAHVGKYDPRYRASFERGYYDAFNSRSSQGGGGFWQR